MIPVGLDDIDVIGSKGTNQLARVIVQVLSSPWQCERIVRHQLWFDDCVPYTSKNGSASIWLQPPEHTDRDFLITHCQCVIQE